MKYRVLKTTVLVVIFLTLFTPFICVGTEEYAELTGKNCSQCHVDPSGGSELTAEGKGFAKELEAKGLYTLPAPGERPLRIVIGFLHMMTAFVWFGSILYIHLFLKPAYVSRGIPKGELRLGWLSMIIMLASGIFLMRYKVPSLEALFHTRFGILLLIKLSLFLLMVLTIFIVTFLIAPKLKKKAEGTSKLDKKDLTVDELAQLDGKEGRPAYIAYKGNIYDVTGSKLWNEGNHLKKHMAGFDLTNALKNAPHGADFLIDGASSLAKRLNVPEIVLHFLYHLHHCAKVNSFDYRFVLKSPG